MAFSVLDLLHRQSMHAGAMHILDHVLDLDLLHMQAMHAGHFPIESYVSLQATSP